MRGYIWSRTIPILPDYLVLGAGPDCFLYEFPQDDILGKLYAYGTGSIVVDKPHNLYLQIFVNEGGIALLAFLAVCVSYLWDCFRLYGGHRQNRNGLRGIAVGLGVAGYLFAGFFNDSTVMTSTMFWILLGVGVGMNRQYRKKAWDCDGKKILYVASTFGHLRTFHIPYLNALLSQGSEVHVMGAGDPVGFPDGVTAIPIPFEKR